MRKAVIFLCTFSFLCCCFFPVSAYRSAPELACEADALKVPQEAAYIELLISVQDLTPEQYTENPVNAEKYGFDVSTEIVEYNKDGYVCYMFHCVDAVGEDRVQNAREGVYTVSFGTDTHTECTEEMKKLLGGLRSVRFAYADASGKVLGVTDAVKINSVLPLKERGVIYIEGETVRVDFSGGPLPWPTLIGCFCGVGIMVYLIGNRRRPGSER